MAQLREGKFAPLWVKLLWTALFFGCFVAGRNIPVPFLHDTVRSTSADNAHLLTAANVGSGANFFSPSLFSLGLGPWMTAAILWRFLFIGKIASDRRIPEDTVKRARNILMVVLALFQANGLMTRYQIGTAVGPFSDRVNAQIIIIAVLTVGAILVAWMAERNEDMGLGGITMFILYQIIFTATRNFEALSSTRGNPDYTLIVTLVIVACVCVLIVGGIASKVELRLHVNKVSIDSGFTGMSYLPIKLNPAGASPIMYALTLLVLPQYFAHAVSAVAPGTASGVNRFTSTWGLGSTTGLTIYLVLLFGMTIFFGLFTVSPKHIAERMQKTGQYFDRVPPGPATRQYLRRRVVLLSAASGVFLIIFTGLPLYFYGSNPGLQYLLLAPGTLMIVVGLLWLIQEEVADTRIGTKYVFALEPASGKGPLGRTSTE